MRFELMTPGLQDQCSNHWAIEAAYARTKYYPNSIKIKINFLDWFIALRDILQIVLVAQLAYEFILAALKFLSEDSANLWCPNQGMMAKPA